MIFGSRRINFDIDVRICNNQITRVSKIKSLEIDDKLTWKDQINNVLLYISHFFYTYCLTAVKFGEMYVPLMCIVLQWYKKVIRNIAHKPFIL